MQDVAVYPANYCQSNQLQPGKNRASFRVEIKRHKNSSKEADPDQPGTRKGLQQEMGWDGFSLWAGGSFPSGLGFPQHPSGSLKEGGGECGNHSQAG